MKKVLSILLSLVILVGIMVTVSVPASAATYVSFDTIYTYTYSSSNKNCNNTVVFSEDGVVYVEVLFPKSAYGSNCIPTLIVSSNGRQLFSRSMPTSTGAMYVFLDKGTYDFNLNMGSSYNPTTSMTYRFQFRSNSNDKVQNIAFNTIYGHYYNTGNAYGSFSLAQNSNVNFELLRPYTTEGSKSNVYLYIYDSKGKEIFRKFYGYSETNDEYSYNLRLPKGTYKFNYYASSPYSPNNGYSVDSYAYYSAYRVTATPASKPKTPKLTHKVTTTKYSTFSTYSIEANYVDDAAYDGVELWVKQGEGKWVLKDSAKNTEYSRYTKVTLSASGANDYIVFYKVRTYSLYGTDKVYSDYSNTLYTKTSLKPKKPSVTVKSSAKKTAKISWKKVSDVSGYEIYRSTKKSSGYKKVSTIKKGSTVSYTNKKLASKKTYYYKVRAYKTINGVKIYSNYSAPKSVKVK